jgi:hypothetical protein
MNLVQVQDDLKQMPDQQLQQELRTPDPQTQMLVMSEVQRRQRLRQGAQAQKPKKSIYEQLLGAANPPPPRFPPSGPQPGRGLAGALPSAPGSGVATPGSPVAGPPAGGLSGMPSPSPVSPGVPPQMPPQGLAGGGRVRHFAGGGENKDDDPGWTSNQIPDPNYDPGAAYSDYFRRKPESPNQPFVNVPTPVFGTGVNLPAGWFAGHEEDIPGPNPPKPPGAPTNLPMGPATPASLPPPPAAADPNAFQHGRTAGATPAGWSAPVTNPITNPTTPRSPEAAARITKRPRAVATDNSVATAMSPEALRKKIQDYLAHPEQFDPKYPDANQFRVNVSKMPQVDISGNIKQADQLLGVDNTAPLAQRLAALEQTMAPREMTQGEKLIQFGSNMRNPWDVAGGIGGEYAAEQKEIEGARQRATQMYGLESELANQQNRRAEARAGLASGLYGTSVQQQEAMWRAQNDANVANSKMAFDVAVKQGEIPMNRLNTFSTLAKTEHELRPDENEMLTRAANGDPIAQKWLNIKNAPELQRNAMTHQYEMAHLGLLRDQINNRLSTTGNREQSAEFTRQYNAMMADHKEWAQLHAKSVTPVFGPDGNLMIPDVDYNSHAKLDPKFYQAHKVVIDYLNQQKQLNSMQGQQQQPYIIDYINEPRPGVGGVR